MTVDWLYFIYIYTLYFHKQLNKSSYSIPNYCPAEVGSATDWSWEFMSPNIYWYWTTFSMFFIFLIHILLKCYAWKRMCLIICLKLAELAPLILLHCVEVISETVFTHASLIKLNTSLGIGKLTTGEIFLGVVWVVVSIHFDFFMDTFYTLKLMLG